MVHYNVEANEEWREDEDRRAAVVRQNALRKRAFMEAQALVEQAAAVLRGVGYLNVRDDTLYSRCLDAVNQASARMHSDGPFIIERNNSATGIGNQAAFGEPTGWVKES